MTAASVDQAPFVNLRDAATVSSYFYCGWFVRKTSFVNHKFSITLVEFICISLSDNSNCSDSSE